jgi:pimeloyl-ACP methyl ester carboxylesterase
MNVVAPRQFAVRPAIDGQRCDSEVSGVHTVTGSPAGLDFHLYVPNRVRPGRMLVAVHGVSRNALEQVRLFGEFADTFGAVVIAPHFTADRFPDYQRLGRKGLGPRADLALIRVLNEVQITTGFDTSQVDLFGFSGGAQFAHRFALVHPQRVRCLGLGAAGWYTLPDPAYAYPYGTAGAKGLDAVRLNVWAAARIPTLVLVGECDNRTDDEGLNRSAVVCRTQGKHRLQRARVWVKAMNDHAAQQGLPRAVALQLLPGVGHSFSQAVLDGALDLRVYAHCYGEHDARYRLSNR